MGALLGTWGVVLLVNQAPAAAFSQAPKSKSVAVDLLPPIVKTLAGPNSHRAPQGYELTLPWPENGELARQLSGAGVPDAEARHAEEAIFHHFGGSIPHGADLKLEMALGGHSERRLLSLTVISQLGDARFIHDGSTLEATGLRHGLSRHDIRLDERAYWSLRALGVAGAEASALLDKVDSKPPGSRLTVVVGSRSQRFGPGVSKSLVYASSDIGAQRYEWLRDDGSRDGWLKLRDGQTASASVLMQPTAGRLSSRFGMRTHPILGYLRFHKGVDYAASWGTPVRAAADGVVAGADWRGGYGRQVRIVHAGTMITSYSHLAEMIVAPGEQVRKGQLVGLVGASGLATGPHLHFELLRGSQAVDPLGGEILPDSDVTDGAIASLLERYRRAARA